MTSSTLLSDLQRRGVELTAEGDRMNTDTAVSATLGIEINEEVAAARADAASAVEHAFRAGELLAQAKAACPHGTWEEWLRENVDMADRTARSYMQLARHWKQLPDEERQRVAVLPLRQVLMETAQTARRLAAGPEIPVEKPPRPAPHAERVEREWKRGLARCLECRESIIKLVDSLERLPLPEKVEDFRSWASVLNKLSSQAAYAYNDMTACPHRIENPRADPHEVTYVSVALAPAGVDLPDLTRAELCEVLALRKNGEDVGWGFRSDGQDMGIMNMNDWCMDPQPPDPSFFRWGLSVERPGEPRIVFHRIKEEHVQLVIENISDPDHRAAFESWMCFFRDQLEAGLELGECLFEGRKFSERHSDSAA